jgi:SAM-dependent methyltransferase
MTPRGTVGEDPRRIAERYDNIADDYAELWASVLRPYALRLLDRLPLEEALRVLDLGTGTGSILSEVAARSPDGLVVGADVSFGMLGRAPGGFPRVVTDLMHPSFRPGSFDVVVSAFVFFHAPDLDLALQRARGLVRAGGWFGLTSWGAAEDGEGAAVFSQELDRAGAEPGPEPSPARARLSSAERMRRELEAAGFVEVDADQLPFEERWDGEGYLQLLSRIGGTHIRLVSLAPADQRRVLDRVTERFASLPPSAFMVRDEVIVGVSRTPRSVGSVPAGG